MVEQGDVYWLDLPEPSGSEPGFRRPHVVVQNNVLNRSRIRTAIVCATTTNLRLARSYGNVLLKAGEANLARQSVVNVSQLFTVDQGDLQDYIGTLSPRRVREIVNGIRKVLEPRDPGTEEASGLAANERE
jgi:mRNA interferase MazF